ncbi:MAG TPA: hypothetical protein VFQ60_02165 [Patescibacteria group bacterium]|nr:hypothetical protein [Patescibacteria group bacterium]
MGKNRLTEDFFINERVSKTKIFFIFNQGEMEQQIELAKQIKEKTNNIKQEHAEPWPFAKN